MYIVLGIILIAGGAGASHLSIKKNAAMELELYTKGHISKGEYEQSLIQGQAVPKFVSVIVLLGWGLVIFGIIESFLN